MNKVERSPNFQSKKKKKHSRERVAVADRREQGFGATDENLQSSPYAPVTKKENEKAGAKAQETQN